MKEFAKVMSISIGLAVLLIIGCVVTSGYSVGTVAPIKVTNK